jgi:hypothetical protein
VNGQDPFSINLNNGQWHRSLSDELQRLGRQRGVYILRDTRTGEIIKVGKAEDLMKRMEEYSRYYVSNGHTITAEIYPLGSNVSIRDAEPVLRHVVRNDGWVLGGEGRTSLRHIRAPGFGGVTADRFPTPPIP